VFELHQLVQNENLGLRLKDIGEISRDVTFKAKKLSSRIHSRRKRKLL